MSNSTVKRNVKVRRIGKYAKPPNPLEPYYVELIEDGVEKIESLSQERYDSLIKALCDQHPGLVGTYRENPEN